MVCESSLSPHPSPSECAPRARVPSLGASVLRVYLPPPPPAGMAPACSSWSSPRPHPASLQTPSSSRRPPRRSPSLSLHGLSGRGRRARHLALDDEESNACARGHRGSGGCHNGDDCADNKYETRCGRAALVLPRAHTEGQTVVRALTPAPGAARTPGWRTRSAARPSP